MPPIHPPVASLLLGRRIVKVSDRGPTPAQSARNGIGALCVCLALTLFIGFVPDSMRVRGGGRLPGETKKGSALALVLFLLAEEFKNFVIFCLQSRVD